MIRGRACSPCHGEHGQGLSSGKPKTRRQACSKSGGGAKRENCRRGKLADTGQSTNELGFARFPFSNMICIHTGNGHKDERVFIPPLRFEGCIHPCKRVREPALSAWCVRQHQVPGFYPCRFSAPGGVSPLFPPPPGGGAAPRFLAPP